MNDKLAEIIASKEVEWKRLEPVAVELKKKALLRNEFRPFRRSLAGEGMHLIAEVKKASPSAGVISENFQPVSQACVYEKGGAHALSVLTDEKYFQGKLSYLADIRRAVHLPLLRKDFIIHELQIYESVVAGADAILLIVAALDQQQLVRLYEAAKTVQLDVLVEVHDMREMDRALDLGADMIGINNRNLKTFTVDLKTTEELAPEIPNDVIAISESGIKTGEDVRYLWDQGINAILVGETLMRSPQVNEKIRELLLRFG